MGEEQEQRDHYSRQMNERDELFEGRRDEDDDWAYNEPSHYRSPDYPMAYSPPTERQELTVTRKLVPSKTPQTHEKPMITVEKRRIRSKF